VTQKGHWHYPLSLGVPHTHAETDGGSILHHIHTGEEELQEVTKLRHMDALGWVPRTTEASTSDLTQHELQGPAINLGAEANEHAAPERTKAHSELA